MRTRLPLLLASLLLAGATAPAAAQDVLRRGELQGVQAPAWIQETLRQDPDAFEFQRAWKQKVDRIRARREAVEAQAAGPFMTPAMLAIQRAAVTGTLAVPVLAGRPSDLTAAYTAAQYQDRLYGPGTTSYTVKSFYEEMSRGMFSVSGTVSDWQALSQPASFYYGSPSASFEDSTGVFLKDALDSADPGMDFGQFDNDGPDGIPNSGDDDGYVDVVAFIYPSKAKSCGGPGIWPHRWVYGGHWRDAGGNPLAYVTNDASANGGFIRVWDYMIQAGIDCDGTSLMPIGTFSHELGHALDIPDLYDTDSSNGDSEGVGEWGLMGSGNWNRQHSPAHMGAWEKDYLGWASVQTLTAPSTGFSLPPVYETGRVLRYDVPGSDEYFLLEHRQDTLSDAFVNGSGLLVWHVDPSVVDAKKSQNKVNADHTDKGVDVEAADGLMDMDNGVNRGDAGDPFPGTSAATRFAFGTNPSSSAKSGFNSRLDLSGITLSGHQLTFDIGLSDTFGDVSDDGVVAALDALVCLSAVVGKDTSAFDVSLCDVTPDDGSSFNGTRTALDALAILSHTVGRALPAQYRVGDAR